MHPQVSEERFTSDKSNTIATLVREVLIAQVKSELANLEGNLAFQ
jgi:hypothetical protein